jgi:hypothetical protein
MSDGAARQRAAFFLVFEYRTILFRMVLTAFSVLLIVVVCCLLFIANGYSFWRHYGTSAPLAFTVGAAFFIGAALFFTLFGLTETLFGSAKLALLLTLVIMLAGSLLFPWHALWKAHWKHIVIAAVCIFVWTFVDAVHSLQPLPSVAENPALANAYFGFLTAEHSFRVENIAMTIVEDDTFPYLNQSYGQAILAAMPVMLGADMPQFAILLWHAIVIAFAVMLAFGCARYFFPAKYALIATLFVVAGNTAVNYSFVSLTDTGHALLMNLNYEILIGLATLLLAALTWREILHRGLTTSRALFLFAAAFSWSVTGAHFALIMLALAVLFLVLHQVRFFETRVMVGIGVLIFGIVSGTFTTGGFLALHAPDSTIPGAEVVIKDNRASPISFRPLRTVESERHTRLKHAYLLDALQGKRESPLLSEPVPEPAATLEEGSYTSLMAKIAVLISELKEAPPIWNTIRFLRSIQLILLPLLFFAAGYWYIFHRKEASWQQYREMYLVLLPLFIVGWLMSSVILIYGNYAQVSRFFLPGVSLALFMIGIMVVHFLRSEALRMRFFGIAITVIAVVPVLMNYLFIGIVGNFILPPTEYLRYVVNEEEEMVIFLQPLSIEKRIPLMFLPGVIRGTDAVNRVY